MSSPQTTILDRFPKHRRPLPPEYQSIYAEQYKSNRDGTSTAAGVAQKLESWMHRKVASDLDAERKSATLEIGAGTLNHLSYEPSSHPYDIVEPFGYLFESSPLLERVRNVYDNISDIPATQTYNRIISIAVFEHICDLPNVVAKSGMLLDREGCLRVGIPSEGTILWKLGYTFTTGVEFRRKHKLDYGVLMKHEHVNTAVEIEQVLRYFFSSVECRVFGAAKSLSLYQFFSCRRPNLERCFEYLSDTNQ